MFSSLIISNTFSKNGAIYIKVLYYSYNIIAVIL